MIRGLDNHCGINPYDVILFLSYYQLKQLKNNFLSSQGITSHQSEVGTFDRPNREPLKPFSNWKPVSNNKNFTGWKLYWRQVKQLIKNENYNQLQLERKSFQFLQQKNVAQESFQNNDVPLELFIHHEAICFFNYMYCVVTPLLFDNSKNHKYCSVYL